MGFDSHAEHMEHVDKAAQVERQKQEDVSISKMVESLNESTFDETSGATDTEMNGVKFSLEKSGLEGYVIANIKEADGSVKSVVLKKDDSSGENKWSLTKMDVAMVRGVGAGPEAIASN